MNLTTLTAFSATTAMLMMVFSPALEPLAAMLIAATIIAIVTRQGD